MGEKIPHHLSHLPRIDDVDFLGPGQTLNSLDFTSRYLTLGKDNQFTRATLPEEKPQYAMP